MNSWEKRNQKFDKYQLSLLVAIIMGDGCLTKDGRLVVAHGNQQKDYCEWKAEKLGNAIGQKINAKPTRQCTQFQVRRKGWKGIYKSIYPKNEKSLYKCLNYIVDPLEMLTIWICDDGNVNPSIAKNKKCYSAAIQIFTFTDLEESQNIANWLEKKIGIRPKLHFRDRSKTKRKSAYILRFSAKDSKNLYTLIKPYLPEIESIRYKFRYLEQLT